MNPYTCDECGRFIPYQDLDQGLATIRMIYPDSTYTVETFETLCKVHSNKEWSVTFLQEMDK